MKIFIVDDEPPAIRVIESLLEQNKEEFSFSVLGTSTNSEDAISQINALQPNLLFLDVEMPGYSGFELLEEIICEDLIVVFVTAYRDYAVEAFRANVVDYIVKPISPSLFRKCVQRISEKVSREESILGGNMTLDQVTNKSLAFRNSNGYEVVSYSEVIYIKSDGAYSEFQLENGKKIINSKNLKYNEGILPKELFKRISRSTIINIEKVSLFSFNNGGSVSLCNGKELLIGKTYRNDVFNYLKKKFLVS
jgi:two-component system LytT family response regulator